MHIGEHEIAGLASAAFAAENDLFLTQGVPFRPAQAAALGKALGRDLIVFLPGDYYPMGQDPACCFFYAPPAGEYRFPPSPFVCWADIRLAGDAAFAAAIRELHAAWVLPFAECAVPAEPGWRESYRCLSDLRDRTPAFTGIAALFEEPPQTDVYTELLGSRAAVVLTGAPPKRFPTVEAETEKQKRTLVLRECEKQRGKRTAVFFPTRRQAEEFCRLLQRRQTAFSLAHGGRTHAENAAALSRFAAGEVPVFCATGHVLASAPFLSADRVLCCGLPLSVSYAARCAGLLPAGGEPLIVYAPADVDLNGRIARSRAAALSLPEAEFLAGRKALCETLLERLRF